MHSLCPVAHPEPPSVASVVAASADCTCMRLQSGRLDVGPQTCLYTCLQGPLENYNLLFPLSSLPYLTQQVHWLTPTLSHARVGFLIQSGFAPVVQKGACPGPLRSRDLVLCSLTVPCPQKPECGCVGGELCWPCPRSSSCLFTFASPNSGSHFLSFLAVLEGIHALTLPLSFQSLLLAGVSFNVTLVEIPDPKPGQAPLFAPAGLYFCFLACITPVIKCLSV